jgi:phospholipid/cholesterol/gamma-HCH transport system substrate-binding protein
MSYSSQERLVGIFVLSALAVIFLLFFINSKTANLFQDSITLHAYLKNAEGISTETLVKVSGIEVGKVKSIDISRDHRIHLTLQVFERYRELVRRDSQASIGKLSVFGRSTIDIEAGSPNEPVLEDGDSIEVEEPLSMDELIAELTPVVKAVEESVQRFAKVMQAVEPKKVESIVANLEESSSNIRKISQQLNNDKGAVGMALYDEEFRQRLKQTVDTLDKTLSQTEQRLAQLEPVVNNIDTITNETGKASKDFPALVHDTKTMVGNINTTLTSLNVEVKQLPDLITRMNVLMEQTDRLLEGISNSWMFSSEESREREKLIRVQPQHE